MDVGFAGTEGATEKYEEIKEKGDEKESMKTTMTDVTTMTDHRQTRQREVIWDVILVSKSDFSNEREDHQDIISTLSIYRQVVIYTLEMLFNPGI